MDKRANGGNLNGLSIYNPQLHFYTLSSDGLSDKANLNLNLVFLFSSQVT